MDLSPFMRHPEMRDAWSSMRRIYPEGFSPSDLVAHLSRNYPDLYALLPSGSSLEARQRRHAVAEELAHALPHVQFKVYKLPKLDLADRPQRADDARIVRYPEYGTRAGQSLRKSWHGRVEPRPEGGWYVRVGIYNPLTKTSKYLGRTLKDPQTTEEEAQRYSESLWRMMMNDRMAIQRSLEKKEG